MGSQRCSVVRPFSLGCTGGPQSPSFLLVCLDYLPMDYTNSFFPSLRASMR